MPRLFMPQLCLACVILSRPLSASTAPDPPANLISLSPAETAAATKVAADLAALWADPSSAAALEPVGAFELLLNRRDLPAVAAVQQLWNAEASWHALIEALLARGDRLSVRAALAGMLWKDDSSWLDRAVAMFPHDPEILLTKAMKNPLAPEARELFLRGLPLTKQMAPLMGKGSYLWGPHQTGKGCWRDPVVVMALAEKAAELPPGHFPEVWCLRLRQALADPRLLRDLPFPDKVVRALSKHLPPFPESLNDFPWPSLLNVLCANGQGNLARECATALLQVPVGPLIRMDKNLPPLTPLWRTEDYGLGRNLSASFGWQLLRMASADQPAALAVTLKTTLASRPTDECLVLHAFLAQGLERPLAAEDLQLMQSLSPSVRQRLLACASDLLPISQFPVPLWAEAVAEELRLLMANTTGPLDPQVLPVFKRYLLRLQVPEAAPVFARLLPLLYREQTRLPDLSLPQLMGAMLPQLSPEARAAFSTAWEAEFIQNRASGAQMEALNLLLKAHLAMAGRDTPAELPDSLGKRLGSWLSDPAALRADPETPAALAALCHTALHFPPWQPDVRRLAAQDPTGDGWNAIHHLIDILDNPIAPPGITLDFQPASPGQGLLTWCFSENGVAAVSWSGEGKPLQNPLLAAAVSRQFEVVIAMDDGYGGPSHALRRLKPIPPVGSLNLTNLLNHGKLTFQLVSKTPGDKGADQRIHFNTLPPLIRTTGKLPAPLPPGSPIFLTPPVPRGGHEAWQLTVDPPPLPGAAPRFRLALLDAAGRIHSSRRPIFDTQEPETADLPIGAICQRVFMEPDNASQEPPTADVITMTGPPVSLAVVATTADLSALPRITVQPIPVPLPPSDKDLRLRALSREFGMEPQNLPNLSGRLEPVRLWTPGQEGPARFFLCGQPTKVVWYHQNALLVQDPLRDNPPVSIPLPMREPHDLQTGDWLGGKLWLLLSRTNTSEGDPDLTTLMAVDPFHAGCPIETWVLNGRLMQVDEPFASTSPAIPTMVLGYYPTVLDTIITADGKILTLNPALRQGRILHLNRLLSPTSLACQPGADGLTPVLDWQSGALRLTYHPKEPETAWQPTNFPLWRDVTSDIGRFGIWVDYSTDPFRLWEQSLKLDFVHPLSENYLLGTSNGTLVRLRKAGFSQTDR